MATAIMKRLLVATLVVMLAPTLTSSRSEFTGEYGEFLAKRYAVLTCAGFLDLIIKNNDDDPRFVTYRNVIRQQIHEKWSKVSDDKLRLVVHQLVAECLAHSQSDFETTVKQAIAHLGP